MSLDPTAISINVAGLETNNFERCEINSDLYSPEGGFSLDVPPGFVAAEGDLVRISVGKQPLMVGTIDNISDAYDSSSHSVALTGRSLLGLLQDSSILDWDAPPNTLVAAAKKYLAGIPHVQRFKTVYDKACYDANTHQFVADVGSTVWSILSEYARNRGLVLWNRPDGTLEFGKVVSDGEPAFRLDGTNIKRGRRNAASGRMHSEIVLVSDNEEEGHQKVVVKNPLAPLRRPFAAAFNGYSSDLKQQANDYLRQEKMRALQMEYEVAGVSQNGKIYQVNSLVQVDDAKIGYSGKLVLHRLSMRQDRSGGTTTTLQLGPVLEDPFKAFRKRRNRNAGGDA